MKARKRFGQHFLVDQEVLDRLASALRVRGGDQVLEVGPGHGELTAHLHGVPARYVAVEIDRDLIALLRARFPDVEVVNDDVLRFDLAGLLADATGPWRIFGNLPYNISTPLLVRLLEHLERIEDMHFMLQREVAARLAGTPGSKAWGRIAVLTQYHCRVERLFDVGPESFAPPPQVVSAVVRLTPRARKLPLLDPGVLDSVLRRGFGQRRKQLGNALQSLHPDWDRAGLDPRRRADDLSVAEFVHLANALAGPAGNRSPQPAK